MDDAKSAYDFLKQLEEQGNNVQPTFSALMEYLDRKARRMGVPLRGQFELTPLCNFDCKMCYTHLTREQMHGKELLTVEQWKSIMHDAWEAGMLSVNLTGGECLTYPGFKELYLYLRELGCEINVLSNGALLNDQWIDFFTSHMPHMLQITLYGGDEDTYERVTGRRDFAVVYDHIRKAMDAKLPVALCLTPSKYMGEGVFDAMRALKALDMPFSISSWLMPPKEETGRAEQEHDLGIEYYERIYRFRNELYGIERHEIAPEKLPPIGGPHHTCELHGLTCGAGMSCFTIEWNGRMLACNSLRDIDGWPFEEGFLNVWNRIHKICADWARIPECVECPYAPICTNCVAQKEQFAARGKQPAVYCEQLKYLVQHGVRAIPACE